MVEWSKFLIGLKKILTDIKEDEAKALQYVIGNYSYNNPKLQQTTQTQAM
jgi:hypothetical protein